jgi:hypothetical protein
LHPIVIEREREQVPTTCLQNVSSGRIAGFLKPNRIANRERGACD